jgi:hypothetical protein
MLTEVQISEIQTKFPRAFRVIATDDEDKPIELILRPATRAEAKRFRARGYDPQWRADATEELITACVVYPDVSGFQAMLERQPLLCEGIARMPVVEKMLGLRADASGK